MTTPSGSPGDGGGPEGRYAWYGRSVCQHPGDAADALTRQLRACGDFVARNGGYIVAHYWDVGPGLCDSTPSDLVAAVGVPRDGGISDLPTDPRGPHPFDGVLTETFARISRRASDALRFEDRLLNAGLRLAVASEPQRLLGSVRSRLLLAEDRPVATWEA